MTKTATSLLAFVYISAFAYFGPVEFRLPALELPVEAVQTSPAPAFRLPGTAGGEIDLAAYAGRPVLFMFFTENCPYCRAAGPALEEFHKTYGPKGLTVLGVSIEDGKAPALNFSRDLGLTFPLAYDGREAYRAYRARGVPYIYLVDRQGMLYDVWEGYHESYLPGMSAAVEKLLAAN